MADFTPLDTARFLRSLRVATATALAAYEGAAARARPGAVEFLALAAKGPGGFTFPAAGLVSGDGLLRASLAPQDDGGAVLTLQALGAAGLQEYAARQARISLGDSVALEGAFDRSGTLALPLAPEELAEANLARFTLDVGGPAT